MAFTDIYHEKISNTGMAPAQPAHWYDRVKKRSGKYFKSVIESMQNNFATILNYFDKGSTNAFSKSFHAKKKPLEANFAE